MERYVTARRPRTWLQSEMDPRGLGLVLLVALLAGCSSSSSPGASGGSGGGSSSVAPTGGSTNVNGGQTSVGGAGATSLAGATATGGSNSPGGTTASIGGTTGVGVTTTSGGAASGSGATAQGGITAFGGTTTSSGTMSSGGTRVVGGSAASGGIAVSGGSTAQGGSRATGGSMGQGANATGGRVATGGVMGSGGEATTTATGGAKATGGMVATGGSSSGSSNPDGGLSSNTGDWHCVNWSDPGDNYQTGNIQPTGLSATTDTYDTALATANAILSGFQTVLKANSIRVGINEPTVSGTWWTTGYKAIIDAATSQNFKVILGYWAHHNGKPDDVTAFNTMWQTVITTYSNNPLVYFDIGNEPYGYTESAWADLVAQWLALFPNLPRAHVLVAGVVTGNGWDADVTQVGADSRLAGTLLNLHVYPSNSNSVTAAGWEQVIQQKVGAYSSRTVATEWGAPLSGGVDYSGPIGTNVNIAFMTGVPDQFRAYSMGSCLWAGLEGTNGIGLTKMSGTGSTLTLTVTNASALARLQYAWGL